MLCKILQVLLLLLNGESYVIQINGYLYILHATTKSTRGPDYGAPSPDMG